MFSFLSKFQLKIQKMKRKRNKTRFTWNKHHGKVTLRVHLYAIFPNEISSYILAYLKARMRKCLVSSGKKRDEILQMLPSCSFTIYTLSNHNCLYQGHLIHYVCSSYYYNPDILFLVEKKD